VLVRHTDFDGVGGFSVEVLEPRFSSWTGSADFRDGRPLAFLCRR